MVRVLESWGHEVLILEEQATRYGAVETAREGARNANFVRENRGRHGGVIVSLPNFGDESGAVAALKEAGAPILIQAYPDDLDKMSPALRRDAFCGKLSIMDVFGQYGLKFTAVKPHVVRPDSATFQANIDHFDRVCRVVRGIKNLVVGSIGARTTPFKTVRIDQLTLRRYGITVETLDLADVIARVKATPATTEAYQLKREFLNGYAAWDGVPEGTIENIAKLGVVLESIVEEYQMDALALRCWSELQTQLGVSPRMFEQFIFPYQLPILERFGLNCYGCCEPLDKRWHVVQRIPHLRRVSVSRWSNRQRMAELLGNRYVLSMKPNPAVMAFDTLDEERSRAELRQDLATTRGCVVEVILKDVITMLHDPRRVTRWVEIALQEARDL